MKEMPAILADGDISLTWAHRISAPFCGAGSCLPGCIIMYFAQLYKLCEIPFNNLLFALLGRWRI